MPAEPLAFLSPGFSICKVGTVSLSHGVAKDSRPCCVRLARAWLSLHASPGVWGREQDNAARLRPPVEGFVCGPGCAG